MKSPLSPRQVSVMSYNRVLLLATTVLIAASLVACQATESGSEPAAQATEAATPEPVASRSARQLPSPTPTPAPATCPTGEENCQIVLSTANIFGAGHDAPPAPGGGGPGTLPPMWDVPPGSTTMTVPAVTGRVKAISDRIFDSGGEGSDAWTTNITSTGGISGIVHPDRGLFLVGVFLTDAPPSGEGPQRLEFTDDEDFDELAPQIAQTFLIGDGADHAYVIPDGTTRVFLGFADAVFTQGEPGWYGNNQGQLAVSVEFSTD